MFSLLLPLLGLPTLYRSDSLALLDAVERALGGWRALPPEDVADESPLLVELLLHALGPNDPAPDPAAGLLLRAHGDIVLGAGGGSLLSADLAAGRALAFVAPALAADEPRLRAAVIERLGLLLASRRDRARLPVVGLLRGGHALLLHGAPADVAALRDAALRAGFDLLAADTAHASLAGGLRLWGQAGGTLLHTGPASLCLVERRPGQSSQLVPLQATAARAALPDQPAPVAAALAPGAHRLLAGDLAGAAALLATLTDR